MNYQTTIQNPANIRFGSAKIEIYDTTNATWIDLGAVKNVTATFTTTGPQTCEFDNAPPLIYDPIPQTWDWTCDLMEAWNSATLQLLRGTIDTHADSASRTNFGVYAGSGQRPTLMIRITNTTAGTSAVTITMQKCKITSELDWTFNQDKDRTTPISHTLKFSAQHTDTTGFGDLVVPKISPSVTITPASVTITAGTTQTMTVTGATTITYGMLDNSIATVTTAGVITGVAQGTTHLVVTADGTLRYIPVTINPATQTQTQTQTPSP